MVAVSSPTLNVNQVYQLLLDNGADRQTAAYLAGISVYEAGGGNPNAINPAALNNNAGTNDYSVGLFQYNFRSGNGFNPSNPLQSTRNGYTAYQLLSDLNAQAQSAISMMGSNLTGISNWSTWTAYKNQIQAIAMQLMGGTQPPLGSSLPPQIPLPIPGPDQPQAPIPSQPNPTISPQTSTISSPFSLKLFTSPTGPINLNLPWSFSGIVLFLMAIFAIIIGALMWDKTRNVIVQGGEVAAVAAA